MTFRFLDIFAHFDFYFSYCRVFTCHLTQGNLAGGNPKFKSPDNLPVFITITPILVTLNGLLQKILLP